MKTTKSNPWAAMDAIVNANPEPMGEEWFTAESVAARYNITFAAAQGRLTRMSAAGKLEAWKGMARENSRTTRKYRVKPV